jgi:4-amino-4-deoxy-L-arabinose transferase-like glycosyltransferase
MNWISEPFPNRKFQVTLFLFFLSLYILTLKGICTGDNGFHYDRIQNIIKNGSLSMPEGKYDFDKQKWLQVFMAKGRDGRAYLTLGDGLSIASLPFGLVGNLVERTVDVSTYQSKIEEPGQRRNLFYLRKMPSVFFATLINPVVMALTVLVFFNFCLRIRNAFEGAFIATVLLGMGTILWPYSSTFWTQPIVTLCLFSAFYVLFLYKKHPKPKFLLLAGALLGYSFITRYSSVVSIPWFILYVVLILWGDRRKIPGAIGLLVSSFAIFFLLQMSWNWYRFGSLLDTGAKHQAFWGFTFRAKPYISLPAMLVGLNRSIFVFSPPLILCFFGLRKFMNTHRLEAMLLLGVVFTYLIFYCKFSFWVAFSSWGPRFLIPITPFLLLPVCFFINRVKWRRILTYTFLIAGITVQLIGALLPLQTKAIGEYFGGPPKTVDYFTKSEIIPQAKMLFAGNVELWFLDSTAKFVIGLMLMTICIASGYYCVYQIRYRLSQNIVVNN